MIILTVPGPDGAGVFSLTIWRPARATAIFIISREVSAAQLSVGIFFREVMRAMTREEKLILCQHPCFNRAAGRWFTRIHLPVAKSCNIKCYYCSRAYDCANENGPGVASKTLSPREALKRVHNALRQDERIRVVGVAGPGEALANRETLETLDRVHRRYPHLLKCISTNGLMLEENLDQLQAVGVKTITVTVNAVDPLIGRKIHGWVFWGDKSYHGAEGAELLIGKQLAGIREATRRGISVKVNTVLLPGVNNLHLKEVAIAVKEAGAFVMSVIPVVPQAEYALIPVPSGRMLYQARQELAPIIRQADHCSYCREDVVGMIR